MPHTGWKIPGDWDGEAWQCIKLQWPDSDEYNSLLVGLLYALTRGREWSRDTGTITEAQADGWRIFDANMPFTLCDGTSDAGNATTFDYRGGSLVVVEGDEMGQVVTNVYKDEETGELVVEFGPCCVRRYSLAGVMTEAIDEPFAGVTPDPVYSACGKALAMVDVVYRIAAAAWENGVDGLGSPWAWVGNVAAAVPEINIGAEDAVSASTQATVLGVVSTEGEIFSARMRQHMLCRFAAQLESDAAGIEQNEYDSLVHQAKSVWEDEGGLGATNAQAGIFFRYCVLAVGANDAKNVTALGAATVGDCACPGDMDGPTQPLPSGFYLGANLVGGVLEGHLDETWYGYGWGAQCMDNVHGCLFQLEPYEAAETIKRMGMSAAWRAELGLPDGYVTAWDDTSESLYPEITQGAAYVMLNDASIAAALAAQLGIAEIWSQLVGGGTLTGDLITPSYVAGDFASFLWNIRAIENHPWTQVRLICKAP